MRFENAYKNLICLTIALIVIVFLLLVKPTITSNPKGIFLPSKIVDSIKTTPFAGDMQIYASPPLATYKNIGIVNVMLHASYDEPTKFDESRVVRYAAKIAAKNGANAIIIDQIFYASPKMVGNKSLSAYSLRGQAIIVDRSLNEY